MALKILFLSHAFYPSIGGIETISDLLAISFTNYGYEVHVLTWTAGDNAKTFPFKVIRNPGIRVLFKEHAWADFVFENNPCVRLGWPRVFFNRPSIIVLQTWLSKFNQRPNLSNKVKLWWLKRATKVVAISEAVRKRCWPAATIIGNSYNADIFNILAGAERNKDFVFIGRLVSDKGADMAIKAIRQLSDQLKEKNINQKKFTLTIIGDGKEKEALEKLAINLDLKENVEFKGSLRGADIARCVNNHRFLLVPSRWEEPFGIVALEGMACGCVPIVSDGGGLPDAVGNAGLTFERGDVDSLVETIQNIFDNRELEESLHNNAVAHLHAHRSDIVANKYLKLIDATVKNRKKN